MSRLYRAFLIGFAIGLVILTIQAPTHAQSTICLDSEALTAFERISITADSWRPSRTVGLPGRRVGGGTR